MSNIADAYAPLYGVQPGIVYGQNDRVDALNDRISARNVPDVPLAPNFDPRPVPTKYELFPILNARSTHADNITVYPQFSVQQNFNPGNNRAPPDTFLRNIDQESGLRNLGVALQHGAGQSVYVPNSTSDMYKIPHINGSQMEPQPHPRLFRGVELPALNPSAARIERTNIGKDIFFNNTRVQLRVPTTKISNNTI